MVISFLYLNMVPILGRASESVRNLECWGCRQEICVCRYGISQNGRTLRLAVFFFFSKGEKTYTPLQSLNLGKAKVQVYTIPLDFIFTENFLLDLFIR